MPQLNAILETCLYVDDLPAAEAFYSAVLGLECFGRQEHRHVFFRCGRQMLLLFNPETSELIEPDSEIPPHGSRGPGHLAFAVAPAELDAWRDRLRKAGVAIELEFDWPQGGRSIYFRDPAGNSLEFATPSIWGIQ